MMRNSCWRVRVVVGTVPLNRDDGTQLELEIFYGDEVAGGHHVMKSLTKLRLRI
ncbi:hypothetical protein [Latilactobacillus sakei]|uniref:hypothetical protein n=1 Tax=Latilactobacillus sakei TaxID=1599 RepID=UPI0024DF44A7|nr:hypothetical protein [Latilactobacillus sakei]